MSKYSHNSQKNEKAPGATKRDRDSIWRENWGWKYCKVHLKTIALGSFVLGKHLLWEFVLCNCTNLDLVIDLKLQRNFHWKWSTVINQSGTLGESTCRSLIKGHPGNPRYAELLLVVQQMFVKFLLCASHSTVLGIDEWTKQMNFPLLIQPTF